MGKTNIAESVLPAVEAPSISKSTKEAAKERLEQFKNEESRLVKGIFQCFETPGASVKIFVKKYAGIQPFEKVMTDGYEYEVPLYVARHLNGIDATAGAMAAPELRNPRIGTCSYPIHGFKMPDTGRLTGSNIDGAGIPVPIVGIVKRFKRYGFQSLEFAGDVA